MKNYRDRRTKRNQNSSTSEELSHVKTEAFDMQD